MTIGVGRVREYRYTSSRRGSSFETKYLGKGDRRMSAAAKIAIGAAGFIASMGGLGALAVPAHATTCAPYGPLSCSDGTTPPTVAQGHGQATAAAASAAASSSSGLAFTGADVTLTSVLGAGAIATGGAFVLVARKRRPQA